MVLKLKAQFQWRLTCTQVIVNLIASTKTRSGLKVHSEIDTNSYPKGLVVSDADFSAIKIEPGESHGGRVELLDLAWMK